MRTLQNDVTARRRGPQFTALAGLADAADAAAANVRALAESAAGRKLIRQADAAAANVRALAETPGFRHLCDERPARVPACRPRRSSRRVARGHRLRTRRRSRAPV